MRIKEKCGMKGGLLCAAAAVSLPLILLAPGRATRRQKAPFMGMNFAHRGLHNRDKSVPENSLEALQMVIPVFEAMTEWTFDSVHDALINLAAEKELKNGRIMWPVRVAASGKPTTPGGAVEICQILGKEETLRRLRLGVEQLTP